MPTYPPVVPTSPEVGNSADKIIVYGFTALGEIASSWSTHCAKLETYLRFQGLEYEVRTAYPNSAPKGKLPYIQHGANKLGDTHLIIQYLNNTYKEQLKHQPPTDPHKLMIITSVRRIVECHLQFVGYEVVYDRILGSIPWPVRMYIGSSARSNLLTQLKARGIADHNEKDFLPMIQADLDALVVILGEKKFVTGDEPTEADAILHSVLDHLAYDFLDHPVKAMVRDRPTLVAYVDRIKGDYFAEPSKYPRV